MKPEIIVPYDAGQMSANFKKAQERITESKSYKDLSTVIITPTRGGRSLCPRFVSSVMGIMRPMNQQVCGPIFMSGMEVGAAFNSAFEMILNHPQLSKFKYVFTLEDDNIVQPDILLKLYENIEKFDILGSLYFTKGEAGQPMIYGDPNIQPLNFIPQFPVQDAIQRCNGTGMGATMFKLSLFRKIPPPWFETKQEWSPNEGGKCYTQDLWFNEKVIRNGGRIAVDTRVKTGHLDIESGILW